ncbi:1934_t:CDS:2, partial [Racocetra persica]
SRIIFDELLALDNNLMDWVQYYKQPYIIASLNPNISKIPHDLWHMAPNSTNCAEAAHAMRQKIDMHNFKRINIKANYNVNINGQDKSGIARKKLAIKRSTKRKSKVKSTKNKKQRISKVIDLTDKTLQESQSNNELKEPGMTMMEKLEYEERMLVIAECKEKLRELQISNAIKEHEY